MLSLLLIFILIVVLFGVLVYTRKYKIEGFGNFYDTQKSFGDGQITLFHDKLGKSIFMNPGMSIDTINDALNQPSIYLPKTKDRDYNKFFTYDPTDDYESVDQNLCKNAKSPLDLKAREKGKRVDCGWYYIDDPTVNSVAALGRYDGPLFPDNLPVNGEWVWDLDIAAQMEDIKYCKSITACKALTIDEVKSKCAFCPQQGYMIPITSAGEQKYPDSEKGSCGLDLIKNVDDCDKPPPQPPIVAQNGVVCGKLGKPSPDNSIRIYTKEECDILNGNYSGTGECLMKEGGSFSWDCRNLNLSDTAEIVAAQTKALDVCVPNAKGFLSPECLISLASGLGYKPTGGLIRNLRELNGLNEYDKQAMKKLGEYGVNIPLSIFGKGDMDVKTANQHLFSIFKEMKSSSIAVSNSAKWLVTGSEIPDICDLEPNSSGPFPVTCLQREFRKAGCQASGAAYPNEANKSDYDTVPWGGIYKMFKELYNSMSVQKSDIQDDAVKSCLGIQYYRPEGPYKKYMNSWPSENATILAGWFGNQPAEYCEKLCDGNKDCSGYAYMKKPNEQQACCTVGLSVSSDKIKFNHFQYLNFFAKNVKKSKYEKIEGKDRPGADIGCFFDKDADFCKEKCDADPNCQMVTYFDNPGGVKGCCYKNSSEPLQPAPVNTSYKKLDVEYKGCFKDSGNRAIPDHPSVRIGPHSSANTNVYDGCKQLAKQRGDNTFAIQDLNECYTGKNPNYDMYGPAQGCGPNGGGWTQQVYEL